MLYGTLILGHTAVELHLEAPCPYVLPLKQRSRGHKGSTFTRKYPMRISLSGSVLQKVKMKVFVSTA